MKLLLALLMGAAVVWSQTFAGSLVNEGVKAFKAGKHAEAIQFFQQAINASPSDAMPRMYLATVYLQQFSPTLDTAENQQLFTNAERELHAVLGIQPDNTTAILSLATLHFHRAQSKKDPVEKVRSLDDSASWYQKVVSLQPENKEAHYSLGVIAWAKYYPELMQGRAKLGIKPEAPGPLPNAGMRADLRTRFGPVVEEGMRHLGRALEIDPAYDDAMAYLNLLYRSRADLAESADEYGRDMQQADTLVQRALATKKAKASQQYAQNAGARPSSAAAPPPPPPPPSQSSVRPTHPMQIRVGGAVQAAKLVDQPQPAYPPLALQARIQGVVRFTATIQRDGTVGNLTLESGHPLLVPAAQEAAQRYRYQPTTLNGEPVEVVSQLDVNFTLP